MMFGGSGLKLIATVPAEALDGSSTQASSSDWVLPSGSETLIAYAIAGNLGAGASVAVKIEQAKDDQGTDAKDLVAATTISADNGTKEIPVDVCAIDHVNGFKYVRVTATSAVGSAPVAVGLLAANPRYMGKNL